MTGAQLGPELAATLRRGDCADHRSPRFVLSPRLMVVTGWTIVQSESEAQPD